MNALAKEWVRRLPEFEQGQNQLRNGNCHCCLGVGCELYRRSQVAGCRWREVEAIDALAAGEEPDLFIEEGLSGEQDGEYFEVDGALYGLTLPPAVQESLGLRSQEGVFNRDALRGRALELVERAEQRWLEAELAELPPGAAGPNCRVSMLTQLNDAKTPFIEIAEFIGLEPPGLFEEDQS